MDKFYGEKKIKFIKKINLIKKNFANTEIKIHYINQVEIMLNHT